MGRFRIRSFVLPLPKTTMTLFQKNKEKKLIVYTNHNETKVKTIIQHQKSIKRIENNKSKSCIIM